MHDTILQEPTNLICRFGWASLQHQMRSIEDGRFEIRAQLLQVGKDPFRYEPVVPPRDVKGRDEHSCKLLFDIDRADRS